MSRPPAAEGKGWLWGAVAFVGHSGSGKTTLLERLVPALQAHGLRVAVVKHAAHHGVVSDLPGTDTRRLWDAGADTVLLVTRDRVVHSERVSAEPTLEAVLSRVGAEDLVLLEGYKHSAAPKIEVVRRACKAEQLPDLSDRIAVVTDVPDLAPGCPVFPLDEVDGLAQFLLNRVRTGG